MCSWSSNDGKDMKLGLWLIGEHGLTNKQGNPRHPLVSPEVALGN